MHFVNFKLKNQHCNVTCCSWIGCAISIVRRATYSVEEPTLQRYLLLLDRMCDFNCPKSYLLNADYFMAIQPVHDLVL
ncbi:hypothetical protein M405DRAFT_20002 [Rhizopogon salebrosus TDB-379]|nr:hypothetical protein M405DRAFT_20002 [Rhizopogon salebrosus TDB-379]